LKSTIPCLRIGMSVIGLEVPHAHIHLVPLNNMGDIHFGKTPLSFSSEEMEQIATDIKESFSRG